VCLPYLIGLRYCDGDEWPFDQGDIGFLCAMVLNSPDGRVARMTNTQSAFG
jgi:phosphatidylglycerophosphate synthase